ncbi:hypothetical protein FHETE_6985 [Fusarium heterosporum]|uniref:Glucose receptor Git3-like N-terminal domain-containing protein n=1 Tax=Fusarium heterosporum TaxID=42747 RepID=A0A8H5WNM9_FUSHE|nr:hypothetical protein FHETE_6985 [Fusarium heterosporum]
MANLPIDMAISLPILVGSVSSCVASLFALCLHVVIPPPRHHFRHALIVNLLIADFIAGLNTTISGFIVLKNGYENPAAPASTGCLASAWVGQFAVQAIDFNILIISLSVLLVVSRRQIVDDSSKGLTALVCIIPWVPATLTSLIGLELGAYGPVSGNWCWIRPEYLGLRYALTHSWRIAIFITTVAIYTFIYFKLRRLLSSVEKDLQHSSASTQSESTRHSTEESDTQRILVTTTVTASFEMESHHSKPIIPPPAALTPGRRSLSECSVIGPDRPEKVHKKSTKRSRLHHHTRTSPDLKKMLLLNGYPIAYIILWLPGMANRLAESVGTSPRWLIGLMACPQFVGLANALTYGITEHMHRAIRGWVHRRDFHAFDP